MHNNTYNNNFYSKRDELTRNAAEKIISIIKKHVKINSAVDFGCGVGTWLSVAKKYGAKKILGFDGEWVDKSMLQIPQDCFKAINLESDLDHSPKYTLGISLEVAEHLSIYAAKNLIS